MSNNNVICADRDQRDDYNAILQTMLEGWIVRSKRPELALIIDGSEGKRDLFATKTQPQSTLKPLPLVPAATPRGNIKLPAGVITTQQLQPTTAVVVATFNNKKTTKRNRYRGHKMRVNA
jgi:hypothetical protein